MMLRRLLCSAGVALMLAGCAAYDGRGLMVGSAGIADVLGVMGEPAMRWASPDGGEVLVYPTGPQGFHTWFVRTDAAGKLVSRQNVLEPRAFALIRPGMTGDEVLRILGPSVPQWTNYFKARDELVWEWRYCDDWNEPARFNVLFDGASGKVRSTLAGSEQMRGVLGMAQFRQWCGH